jgi:hypothetical protein
MDVVVGRCAGLDVHRDNVVATVRVPGAGRRRWEQQTRTFRATLAGLSDLGEQLNDVTRRLTGEEARKGQVKRLPGRGDHALGAGNSRAKLVLGQ